MAPFSPETRIKVRSVMYLSVDAHLRLSEVVMVAIIQEKNMIWLVKICPISIRGFIYNFEILKDL
jgi:hypothetical protein